MNNITCLKIVDCPIQGLCNQLYSLVGFITEAYKNKNNKNIIIVNNFLTEIWSNNYVPINTILNLDITNIFLKKYNISLIDSNNINFKVLKILFGTESKMVDITQFMLDNCLNNNILKISKNINLLKIKGDPCENVVKKVYIHYQLGGQNFCNTFNELNGQLLEDILFDFNNLNFIAATKWKTDENEEEFNYIIKNLVFHSTYTDYANKFIKDLDNNNAKINVIHLRIENDGILWWAHQNQMSSEKFQAIIESKYIYLIKKYINIHENTIVLCADENNKVIEFLKNNGYNFYYRNKDKSIGREINAIIDLNIGENCNNIFIAPIKCSTFSHTLKTRIKNPINTISFSLNNILEKYNIELPMDINDNDADDENENINIKIEEKSSIIES
jgi:hypothetical protein